MNEPVNKRAIGVGAFILIGVLFLVGGIMMIGNLHSTFSQKMTISTVFQDVNGLAAGNNIWFSGVKIGIVKKTEFFGRNQVKVIMNINEESREYIRKDAKVKLSTDGLIGNKILVIYGGTSSALAVEEGDTLTNEIPLSTEEMMNTLQKNNLNILKITNNLSEGKGTVGKLLNNDSIYKSLEATSTSLKLASAHAQLLIASFSDFGTKLNKSGSLVNNLVTDTVVFNSLKSSVLQLHKVADTASVFISDLKQASTNTNTAVGVLLNDEKVGANLKATIQNLESSSKKLDEDLEALQHNFLLKGYFKKKEK